MKRQKITTFLLSLVLLNAPVASAALPEIPDSDAGADLWKSKREKTISDLLAQPNEAKIPQLGEMLRQLKTLNYRDCPERHEVVAMLEQSLLSIPGHAKHYQDEIETMRAEALANSKKTDEEIMKMQDEGLEVVYDGSYERYSGMIAFPTLGLMPSAEAVAVLGHFLNDPEGRNGKTLLGENRSNPGDDFGPRPINAEGAAKAIRNLGIEHPPFKAPEGREREYLREGEVDAWKDWWNEVKDGKRTYRFIGASIEYGPDGPATKEQMEKLAKGRKRAESGRKGTTVEPEGMSNPSKVPLIALILAVGAVIASLAWQFRSR
jgi:hypothetical protein